MWNGETLLLKNLVSSGVWGIICQHFPRDLQIIEPGPFSADKIWQEGNILSIRIV